MVTQVNGMPQSSNNTQAGRRHHQLSLAAAPRRLPAAGGSGRNGEHREQQLRCRAGHGGRRGHERHHQVRHQRISWRGLGVSHQQPAEGAQLFLLPVLVHRRSQPAAEELQNQFGGMFGGPIKKNKLFFFADWERTTRRQAASALRTVPTAALRSGDFNGTGTTIYDPQTGNRRRHRPHAVSRTTRFPSDRIDPAAAYMANLIPAAEPDASFPITTWPSAAISSPATTSTCKINYIPTDKCRSSAATASRRPLIFDPPSLGAAGGDATNGGQPGTRARTDAERRHRRHLYVSPHVSGRRRLRLYAAAPGGAERRYRQELRPGCSENPRHERHRPAAGRLSRASPSTRFSSLGNPNVSNPFLFRDNQYVTSGNVSWIEGRPLASASASSTASTTSTTSSRRHRTARAAASISPAD